MTTTPTSPELAADLAAEDLVPGRAVTLLQRVLMPRPGDPRKVRTLYLDEGRSQGVRVESRATGLLAAGDEVSFATYFNAFPAAYWRRWTSLERVTLRLRLSGAGRVDVYRSKADGSIVHAVGAAVSGTERDIELDLDLTPFVDGGWYWFDLTADEPTTVVEAGWYADREPLRPGRLAVGICTYNRPVDCIDAVATIAADPVVSAELTAVVVADQGNRRVRDDARFPEVAAQLGDRLRLVEQGNLGGSGGFARAMHETLETTDATHLLFLDDDVQLEADSLHRALTFSRFTDDPVLVGGQMLALQDRSVLHTMGEVVDRHSFLYRPAAYGVMQHDFAERSLRYTPQLHRRVDVDYNAWWMCLIPREVPETLGLPLPLFIKWDDAEFGVRAAAAGYPTVSMPGVAVWHVPWSDKNDALDWQAYFHQRNRTVSALLHSPYDRGGRMVRESFNHQIKHLLAMQYSVAELRIKALEDILEGPEHLHAQLVEALPTVRAMRARHADARAKPHPQEFPKVKAKPPRRGKTPTAPTSLAGHVLAALTGTVRQALPIPATARRNPEARVPARDARWWRLAQLNSAVVSTTDGTGATWYRRDPALFRQLLARSVAVHERVAQEWPRLARAYREALPDISSPQAWERTFAAARSADTAPAPSDAVPVSGLVDDATAAPADAMPAEEHDDAPRGPGG
jgi:galactofuranosylgalactofuranosylrhamnosyl-N-acetylglucosaminyl-diphospho-decaprenol beta-1,5/1,6-galactofuranosyltransferase